MLRVKLKNISSKWQQLRIVLLDRGFDQNDTDTIYMEIHSMCKCSDDAF